MQQLRELAGQCPEWRMKKGSKKDLQEKNKQDGYTDVSDYVKKVICCSVLRWLNRTYIDSLTKRWTNGCMRENIITVLRSVVNNTQCKQ